MITREITALIYKEGEKIHRIRGDDTKEGVALIHKAKPDGSYLYIGTAGMKIRSGDKIFKGNKGYNVTFAEKKIIGSKVGYYKAILRGEVSKSAKTKIL